MYDSDLSKTGANVWWCVVGGRLASSEDAACGHLRLRPGAWEVGGSQWAEGHLGNIHGCGPQFHLTSTIAESQDKNMPR